MTLEDAPTVETPVHVPETPARVSPPKSSKAVPGGMQFLSQVIEVIPPHRRRAFINDLKAAIRKGQFDGGPLDDTFKLTCQVRNRDGSSEERTTDHRDFVMDGGDGFRAWYELHLKLVKKTSGLPTKFELEQGHISLQDLANKFRRRTNNRPKAKSRKGAAQVKE